uniref:Uncharacterized protein n=1 Tax=Zea mays TaxID=4577 RepID=C0P9I9_MAIZE|nr:unknown [Zea mays]
MHACMLLIHSHRRRSYMQLSKITATPPVPFSTSSFAKKNYNPTKIVLGSGFSSPGRRWFFQRQKRAQLLRAKQKPRQKSHLRNAALLISSFSPALTVLATILSAGVHDAGHGGFVCLHLLVALLLLVVDALAAATVAAEGGRPARHGRGEVRRLRVPGHDHQYLLLPYRRRQARRRLRSAAGAGAGAGAVLASPPGGAALQVPGELPVGAR